MLLWGGLAMAESSGVSILFDQGHNQRFQIEEKGPLQLSGLADIFRSQNATVTSTRSTLTDALLKDFKALVISGPFTELLPEEVEAVARFMERGGRLAAMLHIGPPLAGLLGKLDIDHSNSVLHERQNVIDTDINFKAKDLTSNQLFSGVDQFSLYGAWALNPGPATSSIARTSPTAWVDLDGDKALSQGDAVAAFSVVVSGNYGAGGFIIFGDDAVFQNRYLDENNAKLAANLCKWLMGQ
jgi:hypothetical protein